VECYIDWNLKYLTPETVQKIHGDEAAELWAKIKQFGKSSFMDWQATGTASFMQKEVLTNKIRAFSEFALGNPVTAQLIDAKELLRQTWDVMEIGKESPILEDKDGQESLPEPVKQRMMQVAEQMEKMGQDLQQTQQDLQSAEQKARQEEFKRMKAEIDADQARALLAIEKAQESAAAKVAGQAAPAGDQDIQDMVNQAVAMALSHMMSQQVPEPAPEMPPPEPMPEQQAPPDPAMQPEMPQEPPQEPPTEGGFSLPAEQ